MKLSCNYIIVILSILDLITFPVKANEIILITHYESIYRANFVKEQLNTRFNIPENLISVRHSLTPCFNIHGVSIAHLCIDMNGMLKAVYLNKLLIRESLNIFMK